MSFAITLAKNNLPVCKEMLRKMPKQQDAWSQEAKDMGIEMGAPAFEYKDLARSGRIIMISSNFALYGDMSRRVMETLSTFGYDMEIYSIDEAFLMLDGHPTALLQDIAKKIRERIKKWTGITVSIGIAETKTLAKIANKKAKKDKSLNGVLTLSNTDQIAALLANTPTQDVWGIGRATATQLKKAGVHTALEFRKKDDLWIQKKLNVLGLRTAMELRGVSCISIEDAPVPRKSILCSRSFYHKIESLEILTEEVCKFTARAAEKLREEEAFAQALSVFIATSPFQEGYYSNTCTITLPLATNITCDLITAAKACLKSIFKASLGYKRAGVLLTDFVSEEERQPDFFAASCNFEKKTRLMKVIDRINTRYEKEALFFAAEGMNRNFRSAKSHSSPKYTTSWAEIPKIGDLNL